MGTIVTLVIAVGIYLTVAVTTDITTMGLTTLALAIRL